MSNKLWIFAGAFVVSCVLIFVAWKQTDNWGRGLTVAALVAGAAAGAAIGANNSDKVRRGVVEADEFLRAKARRG